MDKNIQKNRIEEALKLRGLKAVELVEKSGVKKSSLSSYISQRYQPKQKALLSMARALEVSELWLAGYDVPMERPVEQIKADELVLLIHRLRNNEDLKNLCMSLSNLNEAQISIIKSMVKEFSKAAE